MWTPRGEDKQLAVEFSSGLDGHIRVTLLRAEDGAPVDPLLALQESSERYAASSAEFRFFARFVFWGVVSTALMAWSDVPIKIVVICWVMGALVHLGGLQLLRFARKHELAEAQRAWELWRQQELAYSPSKEDRT